ncbi:hypothetical protein E2C01_064458 [Portunus trituberculatus]|uniref:Uncharacterized protein n=1 Tax=Portunus trituberculatus TaxID=210409 RepID=A0A5B7HJU4_PORTR|nr:hypothetical protein [Portunus trituberculatus]
MKQIYLGLWFPFLPRAPAKTPSTTQQPSHTLLCLLRPCQFCALVNFAPPLLVLPYRALAQSASTPASPITLPIFHESKCQVQQDTFV